MVKLTQVDDETATQFEQTANAVPVEAFNEDSDSDSDSEIEDDFDIENETIYDRIVALRDIIPPNQRDLIVDTAQLTKSYITTAVSKGGSLLWGVTASILLLGVPLALAILAETQLQEMEKEMSLQQSAQEVLAPGSEGAFGGEKTA